MSEETRSQIFIGAAIALSVAAHVATYLSIPPYVAELLSLERVDIDVFDPDDLPDLEPEEPPQDPPEPEAEPPPPPPEPPPRVRRAEREPPPPPPEAPQPPPPPPEAAPYVFDHVLTNDTGEPSSFAVAAPTASAGRPVRPGRGTGDQSGSPDGQPGGQPGGSGPRVVALADLSRRPEAPDLSGALQRNYPPRARAQGVEGVAVLSARIAPDGSVQAPRVRSESVAGYDFGQACVRTLQGSPRWTPPLDANGRPVGTTVTYTCRFRVRY